MRLCVVVFSSNRSIVRAANRSHKEDVMLRWCFCNAGAIAHHAPSPLHLFLCHQLAYFPPGDQFDVVFFQQLARSLACKKVKVSLSPCRSPVGMVNGCCSHLFIVISKMYYELGDAGL